ncbi:MAG TPA: glucose 1-dehydrogenase [Gaiellales bacterium]|nr:glucose 1-dehydrogenase [Gaiellales bacterium]
MPPGRVEGKVCVVTGGASGIGLATCRRLAAEGGRVAVADIDLAAAQRAAAGLPGESAAFPVDVTDDASVAALYAAVADRHGRIDVCHNNAGILLPDDTDPVSTSPATWQRILSVNLTGVFLCLHHQIPHLLRFGGGSIINTASFVALMGAATPQIAYSASKGGVVSMTREVAAVYAKQGIRCNAVCPGPVDTGLVGAFLTDEHQWQRRAVHLPDGRLGTPEEVANAVLYLAGDESSWTNGAAMLVDGGITATYTTAE